MQNSNNKQLIEYRAYSGTLIELEDDNTPSFWRKKNGKLLGYSHNEKENSNAFSRMYISVLLNDGKVVKAHHKEITYVIKHTRF